MGLCGRNIDGEAGKGIGKGIVKLEAQISCEADIKRWESKRVRERRIGKETKMERACREIYKTYQFRRPARCSNPVWPSLWPDPDYYCRKRAP